jgi:hypothetical protein
MKRAKVVREVCRWDRRVEEKHIRKDQEHYSTRPLFNTNLDSYSQTHGRDLSSVFPWPSAAPISPSESQMNTEYPVLCTRYSVVCTQMKQVGTSGLSGARSHTGF